ncbi:MAG TPA: class I SAM-dependent methyltransferase [Spirochaetia bacterium]|nr:class I SAM-dependent methyltransferase [Spirochaetia bacterium]
MAGKRDVEQTYSPIDFIFRRSLGGTGDYSGALFDGDFGLTLEEAQRKKHERVVSSLGLREGDRVIDLGCGWGGFLTYARSRRIRGVGVTLSSRQVAACCRRGLEVYERDCRNVDGAQLGQFNGIVSLGAFEHFSSAEDGLGGRQEEIYRSFFRNAATLVPVGRRFFLQTMVFGPRMIPHGEMRLDAPRDSDSYALALMAWGNPGSWLPAGLEQVLACAAPGFALVSAESGRLDYIETLTRWMAAFKRFDLPKYLVYFSMAMRHLFDGSLGRYMDFLSINPNRVCFERLLMDHYRIVLERVA